MEVTDSLYLRMLGPMARTASQLDEATTAPLVDWLSTGSKRQEREMVLSELDPKDSPLLRALLADPARGTRAQAWLKADLPHDTAVELLHAEPDPWVRMHGILARDLGDDTVLELLPQMVESAFQSLRGLKIEDPRRLPLVLWEQMLTMYSNQMGTSRFPLVEDVVHTWPELAEFALTSQQCPPNVRVVAAQCPEVTASGIEQMLSSLTDLTAGGAHWPRLRGLADAAPAVMERRDISDVAYGQLRGLLLKCASGPGDRGVADAVDRRVLAGRPASDVAGDLAAAGSVEELMGVVSSVPLECWAGPEFWVPLARSEHMDAQVYRFVREVSGRRHQHVLNVVREDWNMWEDVELAIGMLPESAEVRERVLGKFYPTVRDRVRELVCAQEVTLSVALWERVPNWGGDEDVLAARVPLRVAADGVVADVRVGAALARLLAPVLSTGQGRAVLNRCTDPELSVGDLVAAYKAAVAT